MRRRRHPTAVPAKEKTWYISAFDGFDGFDGGLKGGRGIPVGCGLSGMDRDVTGWLE